MDSSAKAKREGWTPITFYEEGGHGLDFFDDKPFLITTMTNGFKVTRVFVDNGSIVNILFVFPYKKLERPERKLILDHELLLNFSRDITQSLGSDKMELRLGDKNFSKTINTDFIIVDAPSSYNIILGRPALN